MGLEEKLREMAAARVVDKDRDREAFTALKAADPDQAAWLQAIAAEFGKPDAIRIRVDGKEFRKGRLLLALDGAWRSGATPEQICDGIIAKQAKNESRVWPDWRTAEPGKAIEHVR